VTDGEAVRHSGLIEVEPSGAFARLELSSAVGILTLHPDPDRRSIHGNVVTTEGVRPLAFDWNPRGGLEIADDPFATAILAAGEGSGTLVVRRRFGVVAGSGSGRLPLDQRGVPRLADGREWPLEA
jgi:hypothetical protein